MRTHIKVVALINIVFGALGALTGLVALIGGALGTLGSLFSGSIVGALVGTAASVTIGLIIACISLVGVVAGFGLLNGQSWARYVLIIVSAFRLFNFPFGTLIGAYSLWVLFNSETQAIFATSTEV